MYEDSDDDRSWEIPEEYKDMDEDDFLYDNLLPKDERKDGSLKVRSGPSNMRFAAPVSEKDILDKIDGAVPATTRRATTWAVKVWQDWVESRKNGLAEVPPQLDGITNEQFGYWISRLVMEVRNQNGLPYNGSTLYGLCAGVQRFVRDKRTQCNDKEPLDIYKSPEFAVFRRALDSVLKDLHSRGIGVGKKQAEVISCDLEDRLWKEGVLGDDNPEKLIDTLVYCFGLNFALRSGKEHRNLRPDMIKYQQLADSKSYIIYNESGSKNNSGGIKDRKVQNKAVRVYSNVANPSRCVVTLYKKYMALRPANAPDDVFYLQPLRKPLPNCWYQPRPVGHNVLSKTVKKLTSKVGAEGYYTNHSLRRTCATRLFQEGLDEQRIMAITGHRSTDAVRMYKTISVTQEEEASDILQGTKQILQVKDEQPPTYKKFKEDKDSFKNDTVPVFNFSRCTVTINN